jgi:hypothetical protein
VISEDSLINYFFQKETTFSGLLVKRHYKEIEASLYLSWFIREGKTYESIAAYWHEESDLKDALHLEKIVPALEKQIDLLTEGAYSIFVEAHKKQDWRAMDNYRYWGELQDIWSEIDALRSRRFYENDIYHRPGIPRIETIGKRLVDEIMVLVWKLDNDEPGIQEELTEAFWKTSDAVLPKFNPDDLLGE